VKFSDVKPTDIAGGYRLFSQVGQCTSVRIPVGKGCGFVQFARRDCAERALADLDGFEMGNVFKQPADEDNVIHLIVIQRRWKLHSTLVGKPFSSKSAIGARHGSFKHDGSAVDGTGLWVDTELLWISRIFTICTSISVSFAAVYVSCYRFGADVDEWSR
jgi:hypothetical protein